MNQVNPDRRSVLRWAIHGLGAVFATVLGVPVAAYVIDPLNRPSPEKNFRSVDGIRLSELEVGVPRQGVIRNIRWDAWTVHPNDVVGRIWVIRNAGNDPSKTLNVFTTVCPHLGCSINRTEPQPEAETKEFSFTCPCHNARFHLDGSLIHDEDGNPAPRGMDSLQWRRDPTDPDRIQVDYQNYYQGRADKDPVA